METNPIGANPQSDTLAWEEVILPFIGVLPTFIPLGARVSFPSGICGCQQSSDLCTLWYGVHVEIYLNFDE
jgi:hypothetical protein